MTSDRSKIKIFSDEVRDIVVSDILYIMPSFVKWFYHSNIKKDMTVFPIKDEAGAQASLYLHGKNDLEKGKDTAVLILHGLYGHPAVMFNLIKMALEADIGPVYSLYISYDINNP